MESPVAIKIEAPSTKNIDKEFFKETLLDIMRTAASDPVKISGIETLGKVCGSDKFYSNTISNCDIDMPIYNSPAEPAGDGPTPSSPAEQ